jgi:hypothetical protein
VLTHLYRDNLKANGLLFFTETPSGEGGDPEGWAAPHPSITELLNAIQVVLRSYNPDVVDLSLAIKIWLEELGAVETQQFKVKSPYGGYSEQGRILLRNTILFLNVSRSVYVAAGLMSAERFDTLMAALYREISPEAEGYTYYVTTIGHKPS